MATQNSINRSTTSNNAYINVDTVGTGNPNGAVAGTISDTFFDTTGGIYYVCTTTGSSGSAVWTSVTSGTLNWVNVVTASQTMAVNTGYVSNNPSGATAYTLPTTIAVAQRVSISGGISTGWSIVQAAGQLIHFGTVVTTTGAGGSLSSTNQYDQLDLICIVANTTFVVRNSVGNITYV